MNIIKRLKQKKEQKRKQKEKEQKQKRLIKTVNDFWNECEKDLQNQK